MSKVKVARDSMLDLWVLLVWGYIGSYMVNCGLQRGARGFETRRNVGKIGRNER